jgi:hypothetical protein
MKFKSVDAAHADELLNEGKTLKEVAEILGITPDNLSKKLRALGIRTDRRAGVVRPVLRIDMAPIIEAYGAGESLLSISNRTGISRVALEPRLKKAGVNIRSGTEASFLRMSRLSRSERLRLTDAAHAAVRGRPRTEEEMLYRASLQSRQVGRGELELLDALRTSGEEPEGQRPCGVYNIDIAFASVAVEVCFRASGRPADAWYRKRCKDLADAGYTVVLVLFRRLESLVGNLENVVRELQIAKRDPPALRQHRVILCSSNRFSRFQNDRGQFAVEPTTETFYHSVRKLDI